MAGGQILWRPKNHRGSGLLGVRARGVVEREGIGSSGRCSPRLEAKGGAGFRPAAAADSSSRLPDFETATTLREPSHDGKRRRGFSSAGRSSWWSHLPPAVVSRAESSSQLRGGARLGGGDAGRGDAERRRWAQGRGAARARGVSASP
jgi:hypothetical protein